MMIYFRSLSLSLAVKGSAIQVPDSQHPVAVPTRQFDREAEDTIRQELRCSIGEREVEIPLVIKVGDEVRDSSIISYSKTW